MNEWIIAGMFGLLVVVVLALVLVVFAYRRDAAGSAARRTEQNEYWNTAQTAVLDFLTEQQKANKYLEKQNKDLTAQIAEIRKELKTAVAEIKAVREQLEAMTARAEAAEHQVDKFE